MQPSEADLAAFIEASLRLSGIEAKPGWLAQLVPVLAVLLEHAERVESWPLGVEAEPAPVYEA